MKNQTWVILLAGAMAASAVSAQIVPREIPYQGRALVQGTNYTGSATMKFALIDPGGMVTYWSNDGTSVAGSEPAAGVPVSVEKGLYALLLGDTTLVNMASIPDGVFANANMLLRVWFDDGVHGSQMLVPDQPLGAVGYAVMAATLEGGIADADDTTNELNHAIALTGTTWI